ELWHLEHDLPQHDRAIGRQRRELLVAEHDRAIERHDERRAAEPLELRQQYEVSSITARASLSAPHRKIREKEALFSGAQVTETRMPFSSSERTSARVC